VVHCIFKNGFLSAFLLPLFYIITLNLLNFPTLYLILVFLVAIIVYRVRITGKKRAILTSLGYFFLFGVFSRTLIQEARVIRGPSMIPILQEGDRVIVDKLTYRFREPQAGDIILFNSPQSYSERFPPSPRRIQRVSRIVALPNDEIRLHGQQIFVNERLVEEKYVSGESENSFNATMTVPQGSYFIVGDNRDRSLDSRHFDDIVDGTIPREAILGKFKTRFWPIERIRYPQLYENR